LRSTGNGERHAVVTASIPFVLINDCVHLILSHVTSRHHHGFDTLATHYLARHKVLRAVCAGARKETVLEHSAPVSTCPVAPRASGRCALDCVSIIGPFAPIRTPFERPRCSKLLFAIVVRRRPVRRKFGLEVSVHLRSCVAACGVALCVGGTHARGERGHGWAKGA